MQGTRNLILAAMAVTAFGLAAFTIGDRLTVRDTLGREPIMAVVRSEQLQEVSGIRLGRGDDEVVLEKVGGVWRLPRLGDYEANQEAVEGWLEALSEIEILEPRTSDPAQLARLDLDPTADQAAISVTLEGNDGVAEAGFVIGRAAPDFVAPGATTFYLRTEGSSQAWLAQGRLPTSLDQDDWMASELLNIEADEIRSVTFADGTAAPLQVTKRQDGGFDIFAADDVIATEQAGFGSIFEIFAPLEAMDVVPLDEAPIGDAGFLLYLSLSNRLLIEIAADTAGPDNRDRVRVRSFLADRVGLDPYRAEALEDRAEAMNAARGDWAFTLSPEVWTTIRTTFNQLRRLAEDSASDA